MSSRHVEKPCPCCLREMRHISDYPFMQVDSLVCEKDSTTTTILESIGDTRATIIRIMRWRQDQTCPPQFDVIEGPVSEHIVQNAQTGEVKIRRTRPMPTYVRKESPPSPSDVSLIAECVRILNGVVALLRNACEQQQPVSKAAFDAATSYLNIYMATDNMDDNTYTVELSRDVPGTFGMTESFYTMCKIRVRGVFVTGHHGNLTCSKKT